MELVAIILNPASRIFPSTFEMIKNCNLKDLAISHANMDSLIFKLQDSKPFKFSVIVLCVGKVKGVLLFSYCTLDQVCCIVANALWQIIQHS